ncbi:hypothetical protein D3C73_1459240 [compost metagenome]
MEGRFAAAERNDFAIQNEGVCTAVAVGLSQLRILNCAPVTAAVDQLHTVPVIIRKHADSVPFDLGDPLAAGRELRSEYRFKRCNRLHFHGAPPEYFEKAKV